MIERGWWAEPRETGQLGQFLCAAWKRKRPAISGGKEGGRPCLERLERSKGSVQVPRRPVGCGAARERRLVSGVGRLGFELAACLAPGGAPVA